jgi:formiminoglutamate deiminase
MSNVVLKGFVNVHSHAFQRALRGRVQSKDPSRKDTFWTWREAMYDLANSFDLNRIESIARLCYMECLEAGYTAVGEFHYLHHAPDGSQWPDRTAASQALIRAAKQTGIRLALLWTVYQQGGFSKALESGQKRFSAGDLDSVWSSIDSLLSEQKAERMHVGLALHSVRAVPEDWLGPLVEGARARGLRIHAHVSEQVLENQECLQATGLTPIALLAKHGVLGSDFTAIHATWISDEDLQLLSKHDATVGLCPTTEGDLGDGVPRTADLHQAGVRMCIGSDSHAVIDPFCELRFLEYQARAQTQSRCVLADDEGFVAPVLARIGSENGLHSLGFKTNTDLVRIQDDATAMQETSTPFETAIMSGHPGLISSVEVAGTEVVTMGRHHLR